ncbi:hypothetical protein [Saccharopolyspora oryzae]|uniref:Uncharacterized protein n=1 Tax=Saccharopolyspora oryzae TaxID=2997343 RepID=A0ABT4UVY9_9PSEU|nr:hypothetical protein [Saccharopolyspora oryzae]MDA3625865.1 hypothetical protein [Saccharopolyspora oryzae]
MGIRREAAVLLAALGTLAAGSSVVAATAWAGPPLNVEVGEAQCLHADSPLIPAPLKGAYPMVTLKMSSTAKENERTDYSVAVNGTERAFGTVAGGGTAVNSISVDNGKPSRVVVTSGKSIVLDRMVTGRC